MVKYCRDCVKMFLKVKIKTMTIKKIKAAVSDSLPFSSI